MNALYHLQSIKQQIDLELQRPLKDFGVDVPKCIVALKGRYELLALAFKKVRERQKNESHSDTVISELDQI